MRASSALRHECLATPAGVHTRQFDDELLLLDLNSGQYYSLNRVGTRMYNAMVAGKSPDQVGSELAGDYELDAEKLVLDCVALANDLIDRGLLRRVRP